MRHADWSVLINSYFTAEETDEEILRDYRTWQRQLRTHLLGPDLNLRAPAWQPLTFLPTVTGLCGGPPGGGGGGESEGYVTPSRTIENLLPGPGNFKRARRNWLPSFRFGCWLVLPIWLTDRGFRIFSLSLSLPFWNLFTTATYDSFSKYLQPSNPGKFSSPDANPAPLDSHSKFRKEEW